MDQVKAGVIYLQENAKERDMREVVKRGYQEGDFYALYGVRENPTDWQERVLQSFADMLSTGNSILDWGAGTGYPYDRWLWQRGMKITAVESSEKHIEQGIANLPDITWIHADFTSLNWPAESYDGLVMLYSLLHIPRSEQAALLRKGADLLKPGGVFLLTVNERASDTDCDFEEGWANGPGMAFSHFDLADNLQMLTDAGLQIAQTMHEKEQAGGEPFVWVLCRKP